MDTTVVDKCIAIDIKPISRTQGKIFEYVAKQSEKYNFEAFVENYMNSPFCNITMDAQYAYDQLSPVRYLLPEIEPLLPESTENQEEIDPDSAYWIGFVYRYVARKYGIPSAKLYKAVGFDKVRRLEEAMYQEYDVHDFEKAVWDAYRSEKGSGPN